MHRMRSASVTKKLRNRFAGLRRMTQDTVMRLATRRKTTRVFSSTPVNLEDVLYCIGVAVQAPSGANKQPWQFMVIDDARVKEKLRAKCEEQEKCFHETVGTSFKQWLESKKITWCKPFLTEAPMLLAVFSNQAMPYATESTWLAIGYFLLALEEKSLSTITYTPSYPEKVRAALDVDEPYRLETILPIGFSADPSPKAHRQPPESFIHKNVWKTKS